MIRVGFVVEAGPSEWLGGINYLANLLHAQAVLPNPRIAPVIITAQSTPAAFLESFPNIEVVRTRFLEGRWLQRAGKVARLLLRRDILMELVLKRHRIDLLSHSAQLGRRASIPTILWLADFQHRRLPHFFESAELARRDAWFRAVCDGATRIVVSSNDARRDLEEFDSASVAKSRVLHFVSAFGNVAAVAPLAQLEERFAFRGPYFHLPNQYWAHKNHGVVIDALAQLKGRGRDVLVLSTGHTRDRRNPSYFQALERRIRALGLEQSFRILGIVPYKDLVGLMAHASAVINPSLFEGWSTTVEEAKSLGKAVILSDIPVHREQAPTRGIYFNPLDAKALADAMEACLDVTVDEHAWRAAAAAALPGRVADFARQYEDIVLEACLCGRAQQRSITSGAGDGHG